MKRSANEVLSYLSSLLGVYLEELSEISNEPETQFQYGEKTAYTECLEILATWEKAEEAGIPENIEELYPL